MFDEYLSRWQLVPDGEPVITYSSRLLPVQYQGMAAMLKIAVEAEEQFGNGLMVWWEGQGAAPVFAHDDKAVLLERAQGHNSLIEWSCNGCDDEATRVLCESVARLHEPRNKPRPELTPLTRWFHDLFPAAKHNGGLLAESATIARALLDSPQEERVLHGDIHHGNILDFGERGWLAIDPKRLWGERGFDYANLFCNPDNDVATNHDVFLRRLDIVTEVAGLERKRLLQWIVAWSGLSAAWMQNDGLTTGLDLSVVEFALNQLG